MKIMKYAVTFLLLTALAVAQNTSDAPPTAAPSTSTGSTTNSAIPTDQENAAKAKQLIQQAIQTLGGQAYLTWRTQTSQGRSYSFHHGEPNSLGTQVWRFREYPDKDRLELTKKRDIFEIFNGDKGWEVTFRGVRNLEDTDLQPYMRRRHYSLDSVLREWINQPGVAFFYEGQTVAAQKQTEQVTIMNAKNEAVTLNFDIHTHLPVRKSFTWRDPTDKERNVEEEIYDNYRNVQGILTPFDVTRTYNGEMSAQSFLTEASYNQTLNPELFDPQATWKSKHK
ncbi:MAG TPA: hypothetical protein VN682_26110 [Terriglobales bacterium]|jgi:hypothetical protein|nr:hypothetical protein [Terriglobales bacterium]